MALAAVFGVAGCAPEASPDVAPIPFTPPSVDSAALERHVRTFSEDFHPRSYDQHANLERAADYVRAAFVASGGDTAVQEFDVGGVPYRNIVVRFGPAQGPLLVIGAHYDSNGATPGADDNASGVAGLLELARLLGGDPPPRPVELVAYTLEEPPYFRSTSMGSFRHARALVARKRPVRLMISLEMIGYFRDAPGSQKFPVPALASQYPDRGNFIAIVGRSEEFPITQRMKGLFLGTTDLPVESINASGSMIGVDFSDHASYWKFDMPAVMVTDTAFFRNANYHETGDTADTLDFARMAKVVASVYAVAQTF